METKKQDLRSTDTKDKIKEALFELIPQKKFRQITVVAIARVAKINRKTFYNHFQSIVDALLDIEHDYLMEISEQINSLEPDDIAGAFFIYFSFLDVDDPVRQKLLYDSDYARFFEQLNSDVMNLPFFMKFCKNGEFRDVIQVYLCAATGIYLRWRKQPEHREGLHELAAKTARLVYSGIS